MKCLYDMRFKNILINMLACFVCFMDSFYIEASYYLILNILITQMSC